MTNRAYRTYNAAPRVCPAADDNTARLVNKLKHRGITDTTYSVRATSDALIEDEYKSAQGVGMQKRPLEFDNNYSPYSNVNAAAAAEAKRRAAERRAQTARERVMSAQGTSSMQPRVQRAATAASVTSYKTRAATEARTSQRTQAAPMQRSRGRKMSPMSSDNVARVKFDNGQLADSGPREVAQRRVPFPKFAIALLMVFVVMFFMVQSIVRNYEYKQQISDLQAQRDELSEKLSLLRTDLDERIDVSYIEEEASKIGLVKGSQKDEKYIDLSGADVVENYESGDEGYGTLSTLLSAMSKILSHFFGGEGS